MNKTIITVVGKNNTGIIANVCTYLAENDIDIMDISQTISQEYKFFNMMLITEFGNCKKTIDVVSSELDKIGEQIGVTIKCQREEIFTSMHRI